MGGTAAGLDAQALWRVLVDALDRQPGAQLIERDDWVQLRTPDSQFPIHNKILRARLDPARVQAVIDEVRAEHRERGAGFEWLVDEASRPHDLSDRLEAAGLRLKAEAEGMALAVPARPPTLSLPGVRIEAATVDDAERLGELAISGWGRPPSFGDAVTHWVRRCFAGQSGEVYHWLAWLDDELVGSCTLRVLPGRGYLQGSCVLPHARGRGIYRAMTFARLAALRRLDVPVVVVWADRSTSAPIVKQLGFSPITWARYHESSDLDG